jgi:hypothetical protein
MTSGITKTELQVAIPRQQAEAVLTEFLADKVAHPDDCALRCLEDLLKHHLIQVGAGEQIEFRHQLIQEYYTAESLLKLLLSLGDIDNQNPPFATNNPFFVINDFVARYRVEGGFGIEFFG